MNKEQDFEDCGQEIFGKELFNPSGEGPPEGDLTQEKNEDESSIKIPTKREISAAHQNFISSFETENSPEAKIRLALDFMRVSLSQSMAPRFKEFWEGRRLCLPLFKEKINPKERSELWSEYVELCSEARRLKEILDEQSAFALEQIELAVQALEKDLDHYNELLEQVSEISFPLDCKTLSQKKGVYFALQKELHLLNTLAARVNALRKEVVKTEIRIRIKNKLFERLSSCGDRIFPRRKELIKMMSDEFSSDVAHFIQMHFQKESPKGIPLFQLREEIKALQAIAKVLTLNTQSFTETRLQLSECWDKIKKQEKERKKEFAVKKQLFKQNFDQVLEKIKAFSEHVQNENAVPQQINQEFEEIQEFMKTLELGREEVKSLKDELHQARKPLLEKAREKELERERKERDLENEKREKLQEFKTKIAQLLEEIDQKSLDVVISAYESLKIALGDLILSKPEKQHLERLLKQVQDVIHEKKEKEILNLSEDDLHSLTQLRAILEERKNQRQEIKAQLENYRKLLGGSGFDFEKAMMYRELIEAEKMRLEKANVSIQEIEEKIEQIEG